MKDLMKDPNKEYPIKDQSKDPNNLDHNSKLTKEKNAINISNVEALIMPSSCLGSSAIFSAVKRDIPIYAVKENKTVFRKSNDSNL